MRQQQLYAAIRLIVREGSIRKASEFLAISPSALNRQVLALEDELGIALFERSATGVRLSVAGEIWYCHFSEHLASFDRARETVAALQGLEIGHVRILSTPDVAAHLLVDEVARFRDDHPRLRVAIERTRHDDFGARLLSAEADLALVVQPVYPPGLETLATASVPVVAVMPARAGRGAVGPDGLIDGDLILPPEGNGLRLLIDLHLKRRRIELRPALVTADPVPPRFCAGRPSLQPRLAPDIDPRWLSLHDAVARDLPGRPVAQLSLVQAEGRVLPPAAQRMARRLAERIDRLR
jgi:DNA-binding transcriptional LysR family regulator